MSLRDEIRRLAHDLDSEDEAAGDLWTWLPSHAAAEHHFGDYACNAQPSMADMMREASLLFSALRGYPVDRHEAAEWFYCCTDDVDDPPDDAERLRFIEAWFAERGWTLKVKGED